MSLEQHHYADGETRLTGLLARPSGAPRAAVLVFPTIMNPTPAVENKAKALAEAGYLALIADFYGRRPAGFDEARALAAAIRPDPLAYRRRLRAGLRALATVPEADGQPLEEMGEAACRLLIDRIRRPSPTNRHEQVPFQIVERESVIEHAA